jgi:hypothetical protein
MSHLLDILESWEMSKRWRRSKPKLWLMTALGSAVKEALAILDIDFNAITDIHLLQQKLC